MSIRMELTCAGPPAMAAHCWTTDLPPEAYSAWLGLLTPFHPPTAHPDWVRTLAAVGAVRPWRVLTIRDGGRLIGVVPLVRRTAISAEAPVPLTADLPPLVLAPEADEALGRGLAEAVRREVPLIGLGRWSNLDRVMALCAGVRAGGGYALLCDAPPAVTLALAPPPPGAGDDPPADDTAAAETWPCPAGRAALAWAVTQGMGAVNRPVDGRAPLAALHTPGAREACLLAPPGVVPSRDAVRAPGLVRWCMARGARLFRLVDGVAWAPPEATIRPQWTVWVTPGRRWAAALRQCDAALAAARARSGVWPWTR